MRAGERSWDRSNRRGQRLIQTLADEFLQQRLAVGVSQARVAGATRMSRSTYSRIEAAKRDGTSVLELSQIAGVLGLELAVRLYPAEDPLRDGAQADRLQRLLRHVDEPLSYRTEAPLPALAGRFERRAWDAVIRGHGRRTAVEVEMRVRDAQALERRLTLKRRDDPTERFLLALADTRTNRHVLDVHPELFADLPRLRPSNVFAALAHGEHPETGIVLL
jgi:transcriptional regulator with XRE-family HTH domain